jgi:Zn ribbon nucleic-acid-binding protein
MPEKKKFVPVCPKCGGTDVRGTSEGNSVYQLCFGCGYRTPMGFMPFPEFPPEKINSVQEKIRKKKRK